MSDAPNVRRIVRAQRLGEELGHGGDTLAALEHMRRMQTALRIIRIWVSVDDCVYPKQIMEVADKALSIKEQT